jgi:hypothetical protein
MAVITMTDPPRRVTLGVDTHRDVHMVSVLDELGVQLGVQPFMANPAG